MRGVPMAVCEKTFRLYTSEPYAADIIPVPPRAAIAAEQIKPFDCSRPAVRSPRETKGDAYDAITEASGEVCGTGGCC